jgi:hypothetical protein
MDQEKVFTPAEAVEYLKRKRGIVYSVASLRNLRRHGRAQARHVIGSISLWTKAELDAIEPTARTKRVKPEDEESSSMSLSFA